jgi:hypothetical protein
MIFVEITSCNIFLRYLRDWKILKSFKSFGGNYRYFRQRFLLILPYSALIAPVGQVSAQVPQSVHLSASIT